MNFIDFIRIELFIKYLNIWQWKNQQSGILRPCANFEMQKISDAEYTNFSHAYSTGQIVVRRTYICAIC